MKTILAIILGVILLLFIVGYFTGYAVYERDPCRLVRCIVRYDAPPHATLIGYDEQGLAVCMCPYEQQTYRFLPPQY